MYRKRAWSLSAALVMTVCLPVFAGGDKPQECKSNPRVIPPDANPYGQSYAEWSAAWWQWIIAFPTDDSPWTGTADCSLGQSGPVWFLGGFGTVECTVPAGRALFFPLINVECSTIESPPFHGDNEAELRACAESWFIPADATTLFCEVDGAALDNLGQYRVESPLFDFWAPDSNILVGAGPATGQSVGDGYYIMLAPLPPGPHTLHFGGTTTQNGGFSIDTTYHLTVARTERQDDTGLFSPHVRAFGKSLEDWIEAYWRWYSTGGASATTPYKPGASPLVFLPLPSGTSLGGSFTSEDPGYLKGQIEVTIKPGTPFVLPMFSWISERYNTGQKDDPSIPNRLIASTVANPKGTGVPLVTLDGEPILEDFWQYYVGPEKFKPIVNYPAPTSYGSIAAVAFQGVGFVAKPLSTGKHTLRLLESLKVTNVDLPGYQFPYDLGVIYDNTWIIDVAP